VSDDVLFSRFICDCCHFPAEVDGTTRVFLPLHLSVKVHMVALAIHDSLSSDNPWDESHIPRCAIQAPQKVRGHMQAEPGLGGGLGGTVIVVGGLDLWIRILWRHWIHCQVDCEPLLSTESIRPSSLEPGNPGSMIQRRASGCPTGEILP